MTLRFPRFKRIHAAFLHDIVMAGASFSLALYLRVGESVFNYPEGFILSGTILFVLVCAPVFWMTGMYRGVWRYASLNDLMTITRGVTIAILVFLLVLFLATRLEHLPRSFFVINWFVLLSLLGGPRFLYRVFKDRRLENVLALEDHTRVPVLLVSAGDAAEMFLREINRNPASPYRVVGILSEKTARVGRQIHGIRVLGTLDDLPEVVKKLKSENLAPRRLVITQDGLDGVIVRDLLEAADRLGLTLARLPKLTDLKSGISDRLEIKPIDIEDVLGRPQTILDRPAMQRLVEGRRVLITGAGGTIGNELVRQICCLDPAHISLLDNGEFQLYTIDMETAETHPGLSRNTLLADVRDRERMVEVMALEAPDIVFHAAALKHVPMVEDNPLEGILTNTIGSRNVADACEKIGVTMMVQISTDKAVNPTSIMGATKRLAESYCQAMDLVAKKPKTSTRFVTVRFGNVLGSTGSVIPLFEKQIANGGPVTVTHPDMTRYFMTVREAVELVLQAAALGKETDGKLAEDKKGGAEGAQESAKEGNREGKIFVLDMGEPVRILDLATQVIRLAGLKPEQDIAITFTGARPGEKLFEELLHVSENLVPTACQGLLLAAPRIVDHKVLARTLDKLEELARSGKVEKALAELARLVPEYHSETPQARNDAESA